MFPAPTLRLIVVIFFLVWSSLAIRVLA
jgi:hypothetical protein